jgi:putative ABC transport system permease protein
MFGVGGTIAEKNIRRNRKKYRAAIVSLTIGVATFIGVSSFVGYGRKLVGEMYADVDYNITVNPKGDMTEEHQRDIEQIYKKIRAAGGIKNSCYYIESSGVINVETIGTDEIKAQYAGLDYKETINVIILEKNDFRKYMYDLGVSGDPSGVAFLADRAIYYNANGVKKEDRNLTVKTGDTITVSIPESERQLTQEQLESGEEEIFNYDEKQVKITRIVDDGELPIGISGGFKQYGGLFLIVSEERLDKRPVDSFLRTLYIDAEDPIEFQKGIDAIAGTDNDYILVYNAEHERQSNNRMILVLEIFLYGFIIVIVLIGVTNVVNTINTSMKIRGREFAMLRSVGMTKKEFRRMIRAEGILYSLKAVIFGIPIGLMLCGLVYLAVRRQYDYGIIIPWFSIVIAVAGVALIVGVIMWASVRRVRKQNIIDTIRTRIY